MGPSCRVLYIYLLFFHSLVAAEVPDCDTSPLAFSIKNVTLSNGYTRRGVEFSMGSSSQNFALSMNMAYNNTILKLAPGTCPESETAAGCITRKGGIFDPTKSLTWKNGMLESFGGGDDTRRSDKGIKVASWRYGQDNLSANNTFSSEIALEKFPIAILDDENLTKSTLGLAPNSTLLRELYDTGKIPSRAWSVYWGQTGTSKNTHNDGTLVLGGIDYAKLANPEDGFYEEKFGNGEDEFNTCYLRVRVEKMMLKHPDGREWDLITERSQAGMLMCVVLDYELITVPSDIAQAYLDVTGDTYLGREPGEYLWGMRINSENAFPGTLTIKLTNGFSAEIPNHQLIHPARTISDKGEIVIGNNSVKVVRLNALEGINAPDLPLLGAPFLSQTYLVVDHDNHVMKFANAKASSEQDLQPVISNNNSNICAETTDTPTKPSRTNKPQASGNQDQLDGNDSIQEPGKNPKLSLPTMIGVVAGGIAILGIILVSVVFLIKWHRRRQQKQQGCDTLNSTSDKIGFDGSGLELNHNPTLQSQALPGPYNQHILYPNSVPDATGQFTAELDSQPEGYYTIQGPVYIELDGILPQGSLSAARSNSIS
ncbi:aspartic peptidase domain-containing protein [Tirmania nivea]|nr:aspartic peptidase domain-containing protein [Tirmania nivea]